MEKKAPRTVWEEDGEQLFFKLREASAQKKTNGNL